MIKISEFVNTICEEYKQIDKYYNEKEIYNIIQKEVKYTEDKDNYRIKIDNTYRYDKKFLKNIINKIDFNNLKYKTLEQIYEEKLSDAKIKLNDTITINNIKYLTLDIILEYIYTKNQKDLPENLVIEEVNKKLKNYTDELKQIYMYYETNPYHQQCRNLTPMYSLESIGKIEEILL